MPSWSLRIDGFPATEIAAHTPPKIETQADGGVTSVSWAFALSRRSQPRALRRGAIVEVMRGPLPFATAVLTDPDRSTWECNAKGIGATLNDYLALDQPTGAVTRDLKAALVYARSIGCKVLSPTLTDGSYVASGELPGQPETVAKVASDYAAQVASRWGVDGRRIFYMRPDPTTPTLMAAPGTAVFGQAEESTPRRLAGRYFNGSTYETAFAGTEAPEASVGDKLLQRGTLSLIEAQVILGGMLARKGTNAWTNGVTLHREQLTTMGGQDADLSSVYGGLMMRAQGIAYGDVSSSVRLDVVLGKTVWTVGEPTIYLEPVGTVPRDLESSLAAA